MAYAWRYENPQGVHFPPPPMRKADPLRILLVEDTQSDIALTRIALDATGIPYGVGVLEKGSDVMPYLLRQPPYQYVHAPDLILLDLGLPDQDGFEILAELAALPSTMRSIPIVLLTGYEHFSYVQKSYGLWIPAYLTKPCKAEDIREILLRIQRERLRQKSELKFH